MADLRERVEAELDLLDRALDELPAADRLSKLSPLELAGTAALIHNIYNGIENILKQLIVHHGYAIPSGASWHRDVLALAHEAGLIGQDLQSRLASYLGLGVTLSPAPCVALLDPSAATGRRPRPRKGQSRAKH